MYNKSRKIYYDHKSDEKIIEIIIPSGKNRTFCDEKTTTC